MTVKLQTRISSLLLIMALGFLGCVDLPSEFKAPIIPYEGITVPIVDKEYTLLEAVEKDTTYLSWYKSDTSKSQLVYRDHKVLNKSTVGNNLYVNPPSKSVVSGVIGPIKIPNEQISTSLKFSDWTNLYQAGKPSPGGISVDPVQTDIGLPVLTKFKSATFENGTIDLIIKNNFPKKSELYLVVKDIIIKDVSSNASLVDNSGRIDTIAPGSSRTITLSLKTGTVVSNQLKFVSTVGATSKSVATDTFTTPVKALDITQTLKNLTISDAAAIIPEQDPIVQSGQVKFHKYDSIKVSYCDIKTGDITIDIDNSLDLSAKLYLKINEFYRSASSTLPFDTTIILPRKGKNLVTLNLANFRLRANKLNPTKSDTISKVTYSTKAMVDTSVNGTDYRSISKTDGVNTTVTVSKLVFKSIYARMTPTVLPTTKDIVSIDLKDIKGKLKFTNILFGTNSKINLKFNSVAEADVNLKGTVSAPEAQKTLNINKTITATDKSVSLSATDFLSSFKNDPPTNLYVDIVPTFNPTYSDAKAQDTSTVTPVVDIDIPLQIAVVGGQINDTTKDGDIDTPDQKNRDKAKDVKTAKLFLEITNGIPAQVKTDIYIWDKNKKTILTIPTAGNDYIYVPAAQVDANGKVTAPTVKIIQQTLTGDDIDKLFDVKYVNIKAKLNTSGASGIPVEFKTDDKIKIKGYVKVDYNLNPDKL